MTVKIAIFKAIQSALKQSDIYTDFTVDQGQTTHYQCSVILKQKLPKDAKLALAQSICNMLIEEDFIENAYASGPGFINIDVTDYELSRSLESLTSSPTCGIHNKETGLVYLDYGGANIAKDLHIGHIRSAVIGDTLKNIYETIGYRVSVYPHFGDFGLHIGHTISQMKRDGVRVKITTNHRLTLKDVDHKTVTDFSSYYRRGSKSAKDNPEHMTESRDVLLSLQNNSCRENKGFFNALCYLSKEAIRYQYGLLGVHFSNNSGEYAALDSIGHIVASLSNRAMLEKSDGAEVIRTSHDDPVILKNSYGCYGYAATDLCELLNRVTRMKNDILGKDHSEIVYLADDRQKHHFDQVFEVADKILDLSDIEVKHIGFGTINGTDGKPFKTRSGDTVLLEDVFNQIEQRIKENYPDVNDADAKRIVCSCIRYSELMCSRSKSYVFDMDVMTSTQGQTGPYILYTYLRFEKLIHTALEKTNGTAGPISILTDVERDIALVMSNYSDVINLCARTYKPHHLAHHAYALCAAMNRFYGQISLLHESDRERLNSLVSLCLSALKQLQSTVDILGLTVPKKM